MDPFIKERLEMAFFDKGVLKKSLQKNISQLKSLELEEDGDDYQLNSVGNSFTAWDDKGLPHDTNSLIKLYRQLSSSSKVDEALNEIRNEIFVFDVPGKRAFELDFSLDSDINEHLKKKIVEEFHNIYSMLDFHNNGPRLFDDWYIDGRLIGQKIVDFKDLKKGIQKFVTISPFKIKKIKVVPKKDDDGTYDLNDVEEFFVHSENFNEEYNSDSVTVVNSVHNVRGTKIDPDLISFVNSGCFSKELGKYVGFLKKVILPFNNLKMMETSMVIFRAVRAPQRRAIYVGVGSMQPTKAEEYMRKLKSRFQTKMSYDTGTGSLKNYNNVMSMLEDYWLPRRDDGKNTEIQTLQGQDSNDILDEVKYHQDEFRRALNVPLSRFDASQRSSLQFSRVAEIDRDEYRFKKFISKLRHHFMFLFEDLLRTQLLLKGILSADEWGDIKRDITWVYTEDNAFIEYKESEKINNRIETLQNVDKYIGTFFSKRWARKHILRQTDNEIVEEDKQIKKEGNLNEDFT